MKMKNLSLYVVIISLGVLLIGVGNALGLCLAGYIDDDDQDIIGEDPDSGMEYGAYHPEIAAYNEYVVVAYAHDTNSWYGGSFVQNVKIAISDDYGASFSIFEWVKYDGTHRQDYPDVQIVVDKTQGDMIKIVVVWQERDRDNSDHWKIFARERLGIDSGGQWHPTVWQFSDEQSDNIYPKVSTESHGNIIHWNVVWQKVYNYEYDIYGIQFRLYYHYTNDWASLSVIQDIILPSSEINEVKSARHPAIECFPITGTTNELIFIIYQCELNPDPEQLTPTVEYRIRVEHGDLVDYTGPYEQDEYDDLAEVPSDNVDFPDITVSYCHLDDYALSVMCVWIYSDDIMYAHSNDGGSTYSVTTLFTSGGSFTLRSIAIDSTSWSTWNYYSLTIAWTDGYNIYAIKKSGSYGNGWGSFGTSYTVSSLDYLEIFVDVSVQRVNENDSYITWQADGTAVYFDRYRTQ